MQLTEKRRELIDNYTNGNISDFKKGLDKLTKRELVDFIYNIQEQSTYTANEILSICYKYIK